MTKPNHMFPSIQKLQSITFAILATLFLSNTLQAARISDAASIISQEEALELRMKQGEYLIPNDELACCTAILIAFLANSNSEYHYDNRLNRLKAFVNSWQDIFAWKKTDPILQWSDLYRYFKKEAKPNLYLMYLRENKSFFQYFCNKTKISARDIAKNMQLIATQLDITIELYQPRVNDPRKLSVSKIITSKAKLGSKDNGDPIRIVEVNHLATQETANNHIYKPHYRPVLTDPDQWQYKPLQAKSSPRPLVKDKPIIQDKKNKRSMYKPLLTKEKIASIQKKQHEKFNEIQNNLQRMLQSTIKDIKNNIQTYNTEDLEASMQLYEKAESSGLVEALSEDTPIQSSKDMKKEIEHTVLTIQKEIDDIDFLDKEYQQKPKNEKGKHFEDLNKKMKFVFFVDGKDKDYTTKDRSKDIEKSIHEKMDEVKTKAETILEKEEIPQQSCEELNSCLQTFDTFAQHINAEEVKETTKQTKKYQKETSEGLTVKVNEIKKKGIENLDNNKNLIDHLIALKTIEKYVDKTYTQNTDPERVTEEILNEFKEKHGDESGIKLNELAANLRKHPIGMQMVSENATFRGIAIMLRNTAFESITFKDILTDIQQYNSIEKEDFVITKAKIAKQLLAKIEKAYQRFYTEYWKLIDSNIGSNNAPSIIAASIKKKYIQQDQILGKVNWQNSIRQTIPDILAHLFAFWTLRNAKYYKDAKGIQLEERKKYLMQPHAAQIVAIFRMLGVDQEALNNHLIQIGTGEGKSVVAFATTTTLALLGFDVSCVCYSQYLSLRDEKAFMPLIQELGMYRHVHYTTFNQLCEAMINQRGDIRDQVVRLIEQTSSLDLKDADDEIIELDDDDEKNDISDSESEDNPLSRIYLDTNDQQPKSKITRARIIFIDEVDVFFNKDFYGSPYSPTAILKHPTIAQLIHFVWDSRNHITYSKVKNAPVYQKCLKTFPKWEAIIEEAVKNMMSDVTKFDSPQYTIDKGRLCYKEGDSMNSKITYKYKTIFACLNEKQRITKESLEELLGIYLNCGLFSYAEIPYQFDLILGVTGTLDKLSSVELDIIEKGYNIKQHTYMPSLYGKSKRIFFKNSPQGIKISNKTYYDALLKKEILEALRGIPTKQANHHSQKKLIKTTKINEETDDESNEEITDSQSDVTVQEDLNDIEEQNLNNKRSVIVFFETPQKLNEFYNSSAIAPIRDRVNLMKSDLSYVEKDRCISKAVMAGSITFSIREFGRGTDFVCYDPTVNHYGGVHVIITFFPENISEETQLIGRTARQRNEGSISMILEEERLENLMNEKEIEKIRTTTGNFYELLDQRRNEAFALDYKDSIKYVAQLKYEHKEAQAFVQNLWRSEIKKVTQHLLKYNAAPARETTRTIVLMDATASMGDLLSQAQKRVETMFYRITKVLKEKSNCFSLQFVAYRNYNAPADMILQASPWESKPQNIVQFMKTVNPAYGWSNEAIEVGFVHVLREHAKETIDQVILIGDMPPNTHDDVDYKRKDSSTKWEEQPLYSTPAYYEDELEKIKDNKIPVHAFHIPLPGKQKSYDKTEKAFGKIAKYTGGKCELLNIRSEKGAEQLINIVSIEVLRKTGGKKAVEDYVSMFGGKSYV